MLRKNSKILQCQDTNLCFGDLTIVMLKLPNSEVPFWYSFLNGELRKPTTWVCVLPHCPLDTVQLHMNKQTSESHFKNKEKKFCSIHIQLLPIITSEHRSTKKTELGKCRQVNKEKDGRVKTVLKSSISFRFQNPANRHINVYHLIIIEFLFKSIFLLYL